MKRRILVLLVVLSLTFTVVPASASTHPCDVWAYRFYAAMAASHFTEANFAYGMWLGCTVNAALGR